MKAAASSEKSSVNPAATVRMPKYVAFIAYMTKVGAGYIMTAPGLASESVTI